MSGGQISWPQLVSGWMLIKDTPAAQCTTTDELPPEKPNRNLTKSEMVQLKRNILSSFGIDTLDCMV